jgi:hypothetical protein
MGVNEHETLFNITQLFDIALIELDRPVYFNDFLRPICLPQPKKETPVGTRCYAVGWGKRVATGIILLYFRCLNLRVMIADLRVNILY